MKTFNLGDAVKLSPEVGEYPDPGVIIGITNFQDGTVEYVVQATRIEGAVIRHSLTADQIEDMNKETAE